jgi:hypothetical protein
MAAILADFPVVGKDQKNPSQGYNYRGVDDALGYLHQLLAKHGVYMTLTDLAPEFSDAGTTKAGKAWVRCVLTGTVKFIAGEDGSFVEASLVGEGLDTGDKALMKAQANGLKYVIWYTFCVPTDEVKDSEAFPDPESGAAPKKTKRAPAKKGKSKAKGPAMIDRVIACEDKESLDAIRAEALEFVMRYQGSDKEDERLAAAEVVKEFNERKEKFGG